MYGITRMKVVLGLFIFAVVLSGVSAQERARGIYIDLGLGFGGIHYFGGDAKARADDFNRGAGAHITMDMSFLTIGGALRDNFYLVGTIAGVGDGYSHEKTNQNEARISTDVIAISMYGLGLRWYPLKSKRHLQLGYDFGISVMLAQTDESEDMSDTGFSQRVSIGWDFDSTLTGFAVIVGGSAMLNIIEGDAIVSHALFVKLAFK
ncbi:MAG: hypothetical protein LBL31_04420 [Spirochaetaceae bacterium]|jgi:hypothetical protein|nr:hypothetical protein [Spirochaetaceae bacterium]